MYEYPEAAARALARAARYAAWRNAPLGRVVDPPGIRPERAATLLTTAVLAGRDWLTEPEIADLFSCYGIPMVETRTVADPDAAGVAAAELGVPVALKAVAPGIVHKTDLGAVRLGLAGAAPSRGRPARWPRPSPPAGTAWRPSRCSPWWAASRCWSAAAATPASGRWSSAAWVGRAPRSTMMSRCG